MFAAEIIQGRKLFKGGNYTGKYGSYIQEWFLSRAGCNSASTLSIIHLYEFLTGKLEHSAIFRIGSDRFLYCYYSR